MLIRNNLFVLIIFVFLSASKAQTVLHVSVHGNDKNKGTEDKPFATLTRAKAAVQKVGNAVTVYIHGGTYYLNMPVLFDTNDSRDEQRSVVYKAAANESVIISGAVPLTLLWERHTDTILKAKISTNLVFDQLFVNGTLQHMARYPNYNPDTLHYGGYAADALSQARVATWQNPTGGYVHALHKYEWGDFHYVITGKNTSNELQLEGGFQNNRALGMHENYRFVENIMEELDAEGEWFYDKQQRVLYFWPPTGTDMKNALVEVPQLKHLFEFQGKEEAPVTHITLEGFQLTHTLRTFMETKEPLLRSDWAIYRGGAILLSGAEHCKITRCYFNTVGGNAVFFSGYNRYDEVSGSHFANTGASGICFVGEPDAVRSPLFEYNETMSLAAMDKIAGPKTNHYPAKCLVYDNLMHDLGRVEKQIAGVEISMAQEIKVSHNTIYDVPRSGINIGDGTWGGHRIEHNDVFNTVLETGDHGSFNAWGRDRYWHPNVDTMHARVARHPELILLDAVEPNILHHNRFRCDHGWDIDLDDGSSNYIIDSNVCLKGGLKLREGFYRTVENNIIINNSFHPHAWFNNSGDIFRYNVVMQHYFPVYISTWGKVVDYNFFTDSTALVQAQKNGTDQHSLAGPITFINFATGDYRLQENNLALQVGFKNFPMDNFGVLSPELRRLAKKIPLPAIPVISKPEVASVKQEWRGVTVKNMETLGERSATGMGEITGVLIVDIKSDSPLINVLKVNDVILGYQNGAVNNLNDLLQAFQQNQKNNNMLFKIFRGQKMQVVKFKTNE